MNKHAAWSIAAGLSLLATGPAPASSKPCRGKDGRIVECPRIRKPSPRCKDAKGRFVPCPAPAATPAGDPDAKRPSPT